MASFEHRLKINKFIKFVINCVTCLCRKRLMMPAYELKLDPLLLRIGIETGIRIHYYLFR